MNRKTEIKRGNKTVLSSILFLLLLFSAGISHQAIAQQINPSVVCSGGETFTTSSLSLEFTIGEIATESLTSSGLQLTQGFIQGNDQNIGIEEQMINKDDLKIYPNPTSNRIYLFYNSKETNAVKLWVNDLQGKQIFSLDFEASPMPLQLDKLNPGFYTVSVLFDNHQIINKKIIKQ